MNARMLLGERLLWVFPLLFLIEVIVGGPSGFRFLPVRYGLFVGMVFSLLVLALARGSVPMRTAWPLLVVCGFLVVNLVWATVVPAVQGTEFLYSLNEAKAYLLVIPAALFVVAVARDGHYLKRLQLVVLITTAIVAAVQVIVWIVGTVAPQTRSALVVGAGMLFRGESLYVGTMPDGFFRVFWISSLWSLLALFWASSGVVRKPVARVVIVLYSLSIFVSYSRGLWLAVGVGLVSAALTYVVCGGRRLPSLWSVAAIVAVVGATLGVSAATGHLDRVVSRFGSVVESRDVSVAVRVEQVPHLLQLWSDNPLLGGGYGAYAAGHIRVEETPYSYENMPYAILAKLGLVGIALNAAFILAVWGSTAVVGRSPVHVRDAACLSGAIGCVVVASVTNPMLLNFIGMSIVSCLLVHWADFAQSDPRGSGRLL